MLAKACDLSLTVVAEGQVWVVAGHDFKTPVLTASGNLLQARGVLGASRAPKDNTRPIARRSLGAAWRLAATTGRQTKRMAGIS